jgi:type II secretory pathway pseudopilin PulG
MRLAGRSAWILAEIAVVLAVLAIIAAAAAARHWQLSIQSKLSETRARLSTVGAALEAYSADCGEYPQMAVGAGGAIELGLPVAALTTPVAYLADPMVARDSFRPAASGSSAPGTNYVYENVRLLRTMVNSGTVIYIGSTLYVPPPPNSAGGWVLRSFGPDGDFGPMVVLRSGALLTIPYDPTNGAASGGDVVLTARGTQVY